MPRLLRSERDQSEKGKSDPGRSPEFERGPDYLEILARALRVLTAFGPERRQMSLSEVAAAAGLPRATARRVLITLEQLGHVRSEERLFRLMPSVLELATAYLSSNGVSTVAQPVVERVSRDLGETCSVAILDGQDVVFVARATPRRIVSVDLSIGFRLPATATAIGRVLLGGLSPEDLDAFLARASLAAMTAYTITDPDRLKREIATAAANGYSIVDQEAEIGLRSLAVPVRRYDGALACAIHVGARAEQVGIARFEGEIRERLVAAAGQIGRAIL